MDRLVQEFGTARGATRKASVLLTEQGIVQTGVVVGKGSFVVERKPGETGPGDDEE
ncbi:hypothetical protein [Streptomyces radiopugnans]|uniref:hypothetical protein n=1 Tax=Streptomyces radiopugnans TaxID=403935 RepID=UPI003F1AABF1